MHEIHAVRRVMLRRPVQGKNFQEVFREKSLRKNSLSLVILFKWWMRSALLAGVHDDSSALNFRYRWPSGGSIECQYRIGTIVDLECGCQLKPTKLFNKSSIYEINNSLFVEWYSTLTILMVRKVSRVLANQLPISIRMNRAKLTEASMWISINLAGLP